jgi:hypothetical protein
MNEIRPFFAPPALSHLPDAYIMMYNQRMKRTQIYLTPAQHQYYSRQARENGTSLSQEIRDALDEVRLEKAPETEVNPAAAFERLAAQVRRHTAQAGERDVSQRVDEIVYGGHHEK